MFKDVCMNLAHSPGAVGNSIRCNLLRDKMDDYKDESQLADFKDYFINEVLSHENCYHSSREKIAGYTYSINRATTVQAVKQIAFRIYKAAKDYSV